MKEVNWQDEIDYKAIDMSGNIIYPIGKIELFDCGRIIVNEEIPIRRLLRYTGYRDSKGDKIFEGDKVRTEEIIWTISFGTPTSQSSGTGWVAKGRGKYSYWMDKSICTGVLVKSRKHSPIKNK